MPNNIKTTTQNRPKLTKARTFWAAVFGTLSIYLVMSSITAVWLNRTLTNTPTYVNTVAPLASNKAIQNFLTEKATEQIVTTASPSDLAHILLPASGLNSSQTPQQLQALVTPVIRASVSQIVSSQDFAAVWKSTNQTAHAALIQSLNNNDGQISLNLNPTITSVVNELRSTKLLGVANQITVPPTVGQITIKSQGLSRAHHYYRLFQEATVAVVALAVVCVGLSVWLSVHHAKTTRRILFGVGILSLFQALVLEAPSVAKIPITDPTTQAAARAVAQALLHNLQMANLIIGFVCLITAFGWRIYDRRARGAIPASRPRTA